MKETDMKKIALMMLLALCMGMQAQGTTSWIPSDGLQVLTNAIDDKGRGKVTIKGRLTEKAEKKMKAVVEIWQDQRMIVRKQTNVNPGATFSVKYTLLNADTWRADKPALYKAVYILYDGKEQIDQQQTTFAFRTFTQDNEKGLLLNNQPLKLRGFVWQENLPWLKRINTECKRAMLHRMQEMGCNALMLKVCKENDDLYDIADEMGILLLIDLSGNDEQTIKETVYRLRNHPSVVIWTVGDLSLECSDEEMDNICRLTQSVRSADQTRLLTAGLKQVDKPLKKGVIDTLDITALNNCPLRLYEASLKTKKKQVLSLNATTWQEKEREAYKQPWSLGQLLLSDLNMLVAQADTFFLYRSEWNKRDHTLHLATHWTRKKGEHVIVPVYTDYPTVELQLNGKSLGKEPKKIWQVPYQEGTLTAIAYNNNGKEVQRTTLQTADKPIMVEAIAQTLGNLSITQLRVLDKDQNICSNFLQTVNISLEGDGTILGYTDGIRYTSVEASQAAITLKEGHATVIIDGNGTLKAKANSLIGSKVFINH